MPKLCSNFYCNYCDYGTYKKSSYSNYILSSNHNKMAKGGEMETNGNQIMPAKIEK